MQRLFVNIDRNKLKLRNIAMRFCNFGFKHMEAGFDILKRNKNCFYMKIEDTKKIWDKKKIIFLHLCQSQFNKMDICMKKLENNYYFQKP